MTPSLVGFRDVFVFAAYDWSLRPVRASDSPQVPTAWEVQKAYLTWSSFYPTIDAYALSEATLDPQPRWGSAGALVRRPRTVILTRFFAPALASPSREAVALVQTQLAAAGVFVGTSLSEISGSHTLVRNCLPHKEYLSITDGAADDYLAFDVDENQTTGGECLFIAEDFTAGADSLSPYYDQASDVDLPLVRAADLDLLARAAPRFSKVKYLYLQPFNELVTSIAKDAIDTFVDEAPAGSVEYKTITGPIDSGTGLAEAREFVRLAMIDFFGL